MSATEKVVVGCYLQLDKQPRQNGKTLPCARLMDENAKLRELVRHMWGWLTVPSVSGAALHDISGQMHELGIEVDA